MPKTNAIAETVLYVKDVDQAALWYQRIFEFPIIFSQEDRLRALQVSKEQVLLLFKQRGSLAPLSLPGGVIPAHDGSGPVHLAFAMKPEDTQAWEAHLAAEGVAIESTFTWGPNDLSLYFRDLDNHLLELISPKHWQALAEQIESDT